MKKSKGEQNSGPWGGRISNTKSKFPIIRRVVKPEGGSKPPVQYINTKMKNEGDHWGKRPGRKLWKGRTGKSRPPCCNVKRRRFSWSRLGRAHGRELARNLGTCERGRTPGFCKGICLRNADVRSREKRNHPMGKFKEKGRGGPLQQSARQTMARGRGGPTHYEKEVTLGEQVKRRKGKRFL